MKNAKMNKHLSFEDRCVIEEYLNNNFNFTQIAQRIYKYRTTIARDVKKHRFLRTTNNCNNNLIQKFKTQAKIHNLFFQNMREVNSFQKIFSNFSFLLNAII